MKIYLDSNVFDEALERIEWLFDEFENIIVSFSGGKDSTVTLETALIVARKKKRLPLKVYFLDQEAEWQGVSEYIKRTMYRGEIEPLWIQTPIFLPNAVSKDVRYLMAWEPNKEWMREKDPISIGETHKLIEDGEVEPKSGYWYRYFRRSLELLFPNDRCAFLSGVRAEESPNRRAGLTQGATYKHVTYGKVHDKSKDHYTFYPLYDWSYTDIWTSIHKNNWDYCEVYDEFYRYGISPIKMRISNLHHETAVDQLFYLQEIEPDTWDALQKRLSGINQARHMNRKDMFTVKNLPFMFKDWKEYRNYLLENLVDEKYKPQFRKKFQGLDDKFINMVEELKPEMYRECIFSILSNDYEFVKIANFLGRPHTMNYLKFMRGKDINWNRPEKDLKYIKPEFRGRKVIVGATDGV